MYNFVRLYNKKTKLKYEWLYYVTDSLQLLFIHEKTTQNRVVNSFYLEKPNNDIVYSQMLATKNETSEINGASIVVKKSYDLKEKYLKEYGHIIINKNGGFFFLDNDFEIIEQVSKKTLIFPELSTEDIRVKKTPQGKHWYAWVGIHEVWIDNEHKWNTYQYAYDMAIKYLNQINSEK